ncbi:hypothetical protein [Quatrionicoccus australiensis]|uniref:hypothetical protein n=1 Tax=Quatrionicoccus australiensis TaxID=138118 RepID=UPI001CFAFAA4|nr:hypothetical protein [Quatrionicoccus australiensis]MCB4360296.1 hypothetical protein [Quatrionicoccus australiensis]
MAKQTSVEMKKQKIDEEHKRQKQLICQNQQLSHCRQFFHYAAVIQNDPGALVSTNMAQQHL